MSLLSNIFGTANKEGDVHDLLSKGALVVDVRSPQEFRSGNVPGSKNIPLQDLSSKLTKLKGMDKPIVLCCASGMRSGKATRMLNTEGVECVNGGSWRSVRQAVDRLKA